MFSIREYKVRVNRERLGSGVGVGLGEVLRVALGAVLVLGRGYYF